MVVSVKEGGADQVPQILFHEIHSFFIEESLLESQQIGNNHDRT